MKITVYHGGTQIVDAPTCKFGRPRLDFIVGNRQGLNPAKEYDYVECGIANDRVIDTIKLYIGGIIDETSALRQLAFHKPNNQICILTQDLLNKYLEYDRTISI